MPYLDTFLLVGGETSGNQMLNTILKYFTKYNDVVSMLSYFVLNVRYDPVLENWETLPITLSQAKSRVAAVMAKGSEVTCNP